MVKKVLVSGIQSSGRLHLGNYFGAMKQNIERGNSGEFDSYIFIADYHSMTSLTDRDERKKSTFDIACAYLACGLDTSKVTLFAQSAVPEHAELSWILATVTPMPMLMLAHSYKDKLNKALDEVLGENLKNPSYSEFINEHKYHTVEQLRGMSAIKSDENSLLSDLANHYSLEVFEIRFLITAITNALLAASNVINAGLFTYPVLMASDILMYNAELVPVGKDQLQHIEMTREIAGKFNRAYNTEFFIMPQAYTVNDVAIVPGVDGEKMSKSKGNVIPLFGSDEEIKKAVMGIVTDSARPEDTKDPDTNNIYNIHKLFLSEEENKALRARYENGGLGYKEAKELLLQAIISFISPLREKYDYYQNNPHEIDKTLSLGAQTARECATKRMAELHRITGLA